MNEKTVEKNAEVEIDVARLVRAVWKKGWIVGLAAILCAVTVFLATFFFVTPQYQSTAMFYVNNSSVSVGDFSISNGDISAAKDLVASYIVILKSRTSLTDVIDYAEVDRTYSELRNMITAEPVNSTEIFAVVVTSPDPYEAERIANAIAYVLPKRIDSIIEGTSAKIVDSAIVATRPSSPNYTTNTMIGFLIGLVLSAAFFILREIFDISIQTEEDIARVCAYPVLSAVPDMSTPVKRGVTGAHNQESPLQIGSGISFAASEAYKLLRTKLQFSFADDKECHVIGVSSAISSEGKSVTAANLAYALAQLDKKVLLIDSDMRRPTLAEKLNLRKQPGLSGYLTGQYDLNGVLQECAAKDHENVFRVITAGQNPPNPVELLSSVKMGDLLAQLRKAYDYVIVDLPPVVGVSDAMAMAKQIDGMLLVVRQNHCDRHVLKDSIRQFESIDTKILGVIYNGVSEHYGKYSKYKRYGKGRYGEYYNRRYGSAYRNYEHTDRHNETK